MKRSCDTLRVWGGCPIGRTPTSRRLGVVRMPVRFRPAPSTAKVNAMREYTVDDMVECIGKAGIKLPMSVILEITDILNDPTTKGTRGRWVEIGAANVFVPESVAELLVQHSEGKAKILRSEKLSAKTLAAIAQAESGVGLHHISYEDFMEHRKTGSGLMELLRNRRAMKSSEVRVNTVTEEILRDLDEERNDDAIRLTNISLRTAKGLKDYGVPVYVYGHEFTKEASDQHREIIVHALKAYPRMDKLRGITKDNFIKFVTRPLRLLAPKLKTHSCAVYREPRDKINKIMGYYLRTYMDPIPFLSYELVKDAAAYVSIDETKLIETYGDTPLYKERKKTFEKLIEESHKDGFFSISSHVKPKELRPFVMNILKFSSKNEREAAQAMHEKRVIILDGVGSTGWTIERMVEDITEISTPQHILVFTLLCNDYATLNPSKVIQPASILQDAE